ncbi:unnamed protein product [Pipistrellus nathusii]|uniref:Uncharacterized protein n=1 Tax=Pipistrellus nathusii TaxID=59473 RepID=A0ABN9ZPS1_PIPNA
MCPEEVTLSNPILYFLFLEPGWLCANLVLPSSRSPLAPHSNHCALSTKLTGPCTHGLGQGQGLHTWTRPVGGGEERTHLLRRSVVGEKEFSFQEAANLKYGIHSSLHWAT